MAAILNWSTTCFCRGHAPRMYLQLNLRLTLSTTSNLVVHLVHIHNLQPLKCAKLNNQTLDKHLPDLNYFLIYYFMDPVQVELVHFWLVLRLG